MDLVVRWEQSLYVTAFRILGNGADAEEARQNFLLRVIDKPALIPSQNIEPWLRRCIINESLALLRRRKRELKANQEHSAGRNGSTSRESSESDHREMVGAVQSSLMELTPETRALLSLRFDNDLTVRQIAEVVGKPHTTVQAQLSAAYRKLRIKLALFFEE